MAFKIDKKYKEAEEEARNYSRETAYKKNLNFIAQQKRFQKYNSSRSGRLGSSISKGIKTLQSPKGITNSLYRKSIPLQPGYAKPKKGRAFRQTVTGTSHYSPGRPKGTYDNRYKNFGGVYNYRKAMSFQRRLELLKAQQQANLSPQEQSAVSNLRMQQISNQSNPESQVIPSTNGTFNLKHLMDEIDAASNIAG
jgi:hypothetical protein